MQVESGELSRFCFMERQTSAKCPFFWQQLQRDARAGHSERGCSKRLQKEQEAAPER